MTKLSRGFSLFLVLLPVLLFAQPSQPHLVIIKYHNSNPLSQQLSGGNDLSTQTQINTHPVVHSSKSMTMPQSSIYMPSQGLSPVQFAQYQMATIKESISLDQAVSELSQLSGVEYVEPVYPVHLHEQINDPYFDQQPYLHQSNLHQLWRLNGLANVVVAVIDTGIDTTHLDLKDQIYENPFEQLNGIDDDGNGLIDDITGYNFFNYSLSGGAPNPNDEHGHGTHLAGIIAAKRNNTIGISGLSSQSLLLNLRFLDKNGMGTQVDAAMAIRYAADMGAKIINCSWGYFRLNTILKEAVEYALSKGCIIFAATGNSQTDVPEYPASISGVIAVGSVNLNHERSSFSSYGSYVDFVSYGEQIYSTLPNQSYGYKTGTSQSTAIMSAMAAEVLSYQPNLTRHDLESLFEQTASNNHQSSYFVGHGIVDPNRLLLGLNVDSDLDNPFTVIFESSSQDLNLGECLNYPNPVMGNHTTFGFSSDKNDVPVKIHIFSLVGQKIKTIEKSSTNAYNTIRWNIDEHIPNGTYIYVVEATYNGHPYYQKKQLSIIR